MKSVYIFVFFFCLFCFFKKQPWCEENNNMQYNFLINVKVNTMIGVTKVSVISSKAFDYWSECPHSFKSEQCSCWRLTIRCKGGFMSYFKVLTKLNWVEFSPVFILNFQSFVACMESCLISSVSRQIMLCSGLIFTLVQPYLIKPFLLNDLLAMSFFVFV